MHQEDHDFGGSSCPDYDTTLREQQTFLLNRIDALTHDAAIDNPPKSGDIYTLKKEYNHLIRQRAKLARSLLSDPMEALPPDLWPDIIRNIFDWPGSPVNTLIDLTSVSKGWCSVLTTLPMIWTDIRLDQCEPDYFAKVMMCIQLSGECKIDLNILHLTVDEWRRISSMIVPEGRRIRLLSFRIDDTDYILIRQVLGDFTNLPVLHELSLPNMPSQLSDQQYIKALLKEKMPLIKWVFAPGCTMQDQIWNPYLVYCSLKAESLTKKAVETLTLVPHLQDLNIVETAQTLENIPGPLKSSFGSLLRFTYKGADICRRLTWIGNYLTFLSTHYPENGDADALLAALSRFPRLHELRVTILSSSWGRPTQNNTHTASPLNSIRVLALKAVIHGQYDADWDVFFSIFFPASTYLEVLSVQSGLITDMAWNSIQGIANLRYLNIDICKFGGASSIPLNIESLQQIDLTVAPRGLTPLLARLGSKFLPTLHLKETQSYPFVDIGPYIVTGVSFPNITSLILSTGNPALWELKALSKLRTLELRAHSFFNRTTYWASDVLEAILMSPRDNPALEKITLVCNFVEWDILLLMLERRNFLNEPEISPIKTLVVDYNLPYRLLYPISELLGGRFVERDSNYSFSLEAIGERMWNESLPGCMQCHYSFRECESLLIPRPEIRPKELPGGDKEYRPADKYLVADPPLPLEMTTWLSGRHERVVNFMRSDEDTGRQLHRPLWCDAKRRCGGSVITGDSLVGAHFGHDLQEYDAGVDA